MSRKARFTQPSMTELLTFNSLVDNFIHHRRIQGLAETSLTFYTDVFRFLSKNEFPQNISQCSSRQIEVFISAMLKRGMKPVTINGKLRAIKALFNFAYSRQLIQSNPAKDISFLKHEKHIIKTLEPHHVQSLLNECADGTFAGVRDHAIILLLLDTGARANEILGLTLNDMRLELLQAVVMGKGRKARRIFFCERTAKAISLYLEERGSLDHDLLFVAEDNKPLKIRSLQDRLKNLGIRAHISGIRVSPHTFRHTMAKMYIKNGGDIFTLQKMLGHSTIDMVRNYVEMFGDDISQAHTKFSPVKNISNN